MDFGFERRAWTLIYLCLGLVEGGTAAVMVRALFGDQAPALAVDLVLAFVSAAPAWSNLASMAYARRAQGRPKIAFLFPLLVAMTVCVAALALVPRSGFGLVLFFVFYASARLLWAGVETVRAVLWSVNYPTRARARITGRITINTSVVVAGVGITLGWLVGQPGPWWRLALLAGCACGLVGMVAFRRLRVRREADLLQAEQARLLEGASFDLRGMRALLARDPAFRDYQLAMSVFGAGMLSLTPLLVVCLNDVLHMPTLVQVAVTTALPVIVMPVAVQPWARYLDRHRVVAFRALHGRVTTVAVALLAAAVLLHLPWLLGPGALLLGVSLAAGSLGWTLGHNDFAPRGEETRYMALHVTLTGMRGLVAPPVTVGAYHVLERVHAGWGAFALAIPFTLVFTGARRFERMRRARVAAMPG
ncbi:MAG TPA: MFS transporter [Steroidobacteraceae bacterium]|nr:MFS transporter [Steroidobacteraceae bacterium]